MHITELYSLKGRCAVVIGGAGKIGLPIAEGLAEAGARVYLCSPGQESLSKAVAKLRAAKLDAHSLQMDQAEEASVEDALARISSEHGCPDVLVNSGVQRPMARLGDSVEQWDQSMRVNARGLFVACRSFARALIRQNRPGAIINVASIYGVVAPDPRLYDDTAIETPPDYPFAKGGMIAFTRYCASYFAKDGIRVNCISPGGFFNNQEQRFLDRYVRKVPLGRMAYPDDLKGVGVFLASAASQYITGAVLPVDGGFTIL